MAGPVPTPAATAVPTVAAVSPAEATGPAGRRLHPARARRLRGQRRAGRVRAVGQPRWDKPLLRLCRNLGRDRRDRVRRVPERQRRRRRGHVRDGDRRGPAGPASRWRVVLRSPRSRPRTALPISPCARGRSCSPCRSPPAMGPRRRSSRCANLVVQRAGPAAPVAGSTVPGRRRPSSRASSKGAAATDVSADPRAAAAPADCSSRVRVDSAQRSARGADMDHRRRRQAARAARRPCCRRHGAIRAWRPRRTRSSSSQALAGNRAVTELLAVPGAEPAPPSVQRDAGDASGRPSGRRCPRPPPANGCRSRISS